MDSYSFGMLMWELLYESLPFEGELKDAIEYVVEEDARPRIVTINGNVDASQVEQPRDSTQFQTMPPEETLQLTEDLAEIIRRCW